MSQDSLVAEVLADLRGQFSGKTFYNPKQLDEIVNRAMAPLKDAPPEAAVEFALTGLRIFRDEPPTWFFGALQHGVRSVLRRKLAFTEDQLLELSLIHI